MCGCGRDSKAASSISIATVDSAVRIEIVPFIPHGALVQGLELSCSCTALFGQKSSGSAA